MPRIKISLERVRRAELEVQNVVIADTSNFGWFSLVAGMPRFAAAPFPFELIMQSSPVMLSPIWRCRFSAAMRDAAGSESTDTKMGNEFAHIRRAFTRRF